LLYASSVTLREANLQKPIGHSIQAILLEKLVAVFVVRKKSGDRFIYKSSLRSEMAKVFGE
jgi:hypothetical protein